MSTPAPATTLRALAEAKEDGITKGTIFRVDPEKIQFEEGFNLRGPRQEMDVADEELYQAMKEGAFIPPIDVVVIDGSIITRDGHRRTKAAIRLKNDFPDYTLQCRQFVGNAQEAVLHMLGSGSGGLPLTPLEQGLGCLRLLRFGMTPAEIAKKRGKSLPTITGQLELANASPEVQKMITDGDVSATVAREAVKQGEAGVEALKTAVAAEKAKPKKANGKKNKVTAKKVKGTAAAKPVKAKKEKKPKAKKEEPVTATPADPNTITISIDRLVAQAAVDYIRDFVGTDAEDLNTLRAALETAMM